MEEENGRAEEGRLIVLNRLIARTYKPVLILHNEVIIADKI